MSKKVLSADSDFKGDFGWNKRPLAKNQVVGIFDLVGFSALDTNKDLVSAVRAMEISIELSLGDVYYWAEKDREGVESPLNEILLRSTGDGYVVAFSQQDDDLDALDMLVAIYKRIRKNHLVNLGINKGDVYVLMELNNFVNIIGWGINYAARALQFAKRGQIICTEFLAKPLLKTHGEQIKKNMVSLGMHTVKEAEMELFNYYKKGDFGAPQAKDKSK